MTAAPPQQFVSIGRQNYGASRVRAPDHRGLHESAVRPTHCFPRKLSAPVGGSVALIISTSVCNPHIHFTSCPRSSCCSEDAQSRPSPRQSPLRGQWYPRHRRQNPNAAPPRSTSMHGTRVDSVHEIGGGRSRTGGGRMQAQGNVVRRSRAGPGPAVQGVRAEAGVHARPLPRRSPALVCLSPPRCRAYGLTLTVGGKAGESGPITPSRSCRTAHEGERARVRAR